MVEKSQSKPRSNSDVKPISLQFSHPRDNLHLYIGPLGFHIADVVKSLEKCASDEEQLRVLRKDAEWVPRRIEMAEISAKEMSRWLRYGMMDAAGPFEARVREVLGQLRTAYRNPEELVENGNSCALFRKCHEEIAAIEIKLCATPLDPNDNAKLMWPIHIAVFHHRLKNIATDLCSLAEKKRASTDSIADLRERIDVSIDSLEDILRSVQAQLANALHMYDQYRWPIEHLPTYLKVVAKCLPENEPAYRAVVMDTWRHLRLLLAVFVVSPKPALSPDDHAIIWTKYPDDARAMKLPAPTKCGSTATAGKSVVLSNETPDDLISMAVAIQNFITSRQTIRRATKDGKIRSYRPPDAAKNSPHTYSESSLARIFQRR